MKKLVLGAWCIVLGVATLPAAEANLAPMLDAGVAYAVEQIIDLFANSIRAVHIYTMNRPETAERIMANIRGIIEDGSCG